MSWDKGLKPVAAEQIPANTVQVTVRNEVYFGRSIKKDAAEICKRITQLALIALGSLLLLPAIVFATLSTYARFAKICIELNKGIAFQGKVGPQTNLPVEEPKANPPHVEPPEVKLEVTPLLITSIKSG